MKRVMIAFVAAVSALPAFAVAGQISAYDALSAVGRAKGEALLANLVEMRGADGAPQPSQWTLVFKDDGARGGIREFVVNAQGIDGERTPLLAGEAATSGTVSAANLKLNSTGAFTTVNREASKARLGFDKLNYRLQVKGGVPVWGVQLFDVEGNEVGAISLSAADATIVSPLRAAPASAATGPAAAQAPAQAKGPAASDNRPLGQRWVEGGGLVGHVDRWSQRTWKATSETAGRTFKATSETAERTWESTSDTAERVGDTIEAFFIGRPTQDTKPGN